MSNESRFIVQAILNNDKHLIMGINEYIERASERAWYTQFQMDYLKWIIDCYKSWHFDHLQEGTGPMELIRGVFLSQNKIVFGIVDLDPEPLSE